MPFDFSLVSAPFRMQPGLRRVAAGASQLTPSTPGTRHLNEKTAVLGRFAAQALLADPGFDEGVVFRAIADEAERTAPGTFDVDSSPHGATRIAAPQLGWTLDDGRPRGDGDRAIGALLEALPASLRPSALLSLAFAEDLAVIDGKSATLPWLAVCLPSRWAPEDKIGRHFAEVHGPVADADVLIAAGASLARLVTGDDRWERFVWTISGDPRLDQHPRRGGVEWPSAGTADALAERAWFRSERQTFIPIRGRDLAVFTIHVESVRLADAVTTGEAAARLHAALATMSPAVLDYRGLALARDRLLEWLAARAAGMNALP
jgi:hypothetical protein